ncbi:MAG: aldo/keto reductase [Tenericutes bacterium]|jgi:aryl-alcohol dehydrogenase-like predicted oxidoreductase|nr:aldo/keto reductase [Mycoplasmatota bacterium]
MEYIQYLNKKMSVLGFGGWTLGNNSNGKIMSEEEGIKLVKRAYEEGVTFFDTAPNYSLGKSETIIGKALKDIREKIIINSKFGHHADGKIDFSESKIRESIKGSLKRLKTDYLDSVILHNPDMTILKGETDHFKVLESLKEEGLIRGYGVSIDTPEELETVLKNQKVDVIELLYNIFFQSTRNLLKEAKEKGIALVIKVPLDSGWLTGKYDIHSQFSDIRSRWTNEDKERRHFLVNEIKNYVGENDIVKYAMNFLWANDAISTVIPGIRTEKQLNSHLEALAFDYDESLNDKFEKLYDQFIANNPLNW